MAKISVSESGRPNLTLVPSDDRIVGDMVDEVVKQLVKFFGNSFLAKERYPEEFAALVAANIEGATLQLKKQALARYIRARKDTIGKGKDSKSEPVDSAIEPISFQEPSAAKLIRDATVVSRVRDEVLRHDLSGVIQPDQLNTLKMRLSAETPVYVFNFVYLLAKGATERLIADGRLKATG